MSLPNLTHKDIASELGIAEATVKSYRRAFPEFFELRRAGKPLRYAPSALDVCRIIRDGRRDALSEYDIRERLEQAVPKAKQNVGRGRAIASPSSEPTAQQSAAAHPQVMDRIEHVLAEGAETHRQLLQTQNENADRLGDMQNRLQHMIAEFQERYARQDEVLAALAQRQDAMLDMLQAVVGMHPTGQNRTEADGHDHTEKERSAATRVRHVAVRNAYGDVQHYTLATGEDAMPPEPAVPEAHDETPPEASVHEQTSEPATETSAPATDGSEPAREYLELPLVVRSEMGEYLGVAGKALGSFSLKDLVDLVEESFSPPKSFDISFMALEGGVSDHAGGSWTLTLHQESGQHYRLILERFTTPRGNDVIVLTALEVDGQDVPPANLYLFIKQMLQIRNQQ